MLSPSEGPSSGGNSSERRNNLRDVGRQFGHFDCVSIKMARFLKHFHGSSSQDFEPVLLKSNER